MNGRSKKSVAPRDTAVVAAIAPSWRRLFARIPVAFFAVADTFSHARIGVSVSEGTQ